MSKGFACTKFGSAKPSFSCRTVSWSSSVRSVTPKKSGTPIFSAYIQHLYLAPTFKTYI